MSFEALHYLLKQNYLFFSDDLSDIEDPYYEDVDKGGKIMIYDKSNNPFIEHNKYMTNIFKRL